MKLDRRIEFDENRDFGIEWEVLAPGDGDMDDQAQLEDSASLCCGCLVSDMHRMGVPVYDSIYGHASSNSMQAWIIKGDGSLPSNGLEVASPKLRGIVGLSAAGEMCHALRANDFSVDVSCGLHVHHSIRGLKPIHISALHYIWMRLVYTADFRFIFPGSRNDNSYCQWNTDTLRNAADGRLGASATRQSEIMSKLKEDPDVVGIQASISDRYSALNFNAMYSHGTLEFRIHQGTTNEEKVLNWVKFTQMLITRASMVNGKRELDSLNFYENNMKQTKTFLQAMNAMGLNRRNLSTELEAAKVYYLSRIREQAHCYHTSMDQFVPTTTVGGYPTYYARQSRTWRYPGRRQH